jgi:hypothetical protein
LIRVRGQIQVQRVPRLKEGSRLVLALGEDVLEPWQKQELTERFQAQTRCHLSSKRRVRSCPRAVRQRDQGKALSGKSTLNRLELTPADAHGQSRYKKIVADEQALEAYFIQAYVRHLPKDTPSVTLDLDATDDPIHGQQEGRFFHGYSGDDC